MPDELLLVLEKVEKEGAVPINSANTILPARPILPDGAVVPHNGFMAVEKVEKEGGTPPIGGASTVLPARPNLPDDPVIPHNGFLTVEEGEKAFTHLMRKAGVDANWSWEQTMRATITDPLYKSLNTLAEKKACWEKVRGERFNLLCPYSLKGTPLVH
jgi:pre-mRNA-processing factor 40